MKLEKDIEETLESIQDHLSDAMASLSEASNHVYDLAASHEDETQQAIDDYLATNLQEIVQDYYDDITRYLIDEYLDDIFLEYGHRIVEEFEEDILEEKSIRDSFEEEFEERISNMSVEEFQKLKQKLG